MRRRAATPSQPTTSPILLRTRAPMRSPSRRADGCRAGGVCGRTSAMPRIGAPACPAWRHASAQNEQRVRRLAADASWAKQPSRRLPQQRGRRPLPDNLGSGAAAQHGPSGLRAVAGAASATSAAASSPRRRRAPRRRGVALGQNAECRPLRSQAPRCPMEQKRLKDTLGLTPERLSGVPLRGLKMCRAQAGNAPMTRFSGIAVVDRQYAVAGRREP